MDRRERLLGGVPNGRGLEIGALNAPVVRKDEADVLYVDYAETETVKANLFDPAIDPDQVVGVDIVWGERRLAEAAGAPVDFIVASHVIEHVPDLIGWLGELHEALKPGGVLGLAVPDKRFTFDILRPTTTLGEVVAAYLDLARRPSIRQIFDVASLGIAVDLQAVWAGDFDAAARRDEVLARLKPALDLVEDVRARPRYQDAHCWVFTDQSFLDLLEELATLGLLGFEVDAFFPTEPGTLEFHARLSRSDDKDAVLASIRAARRELADAIPSPSPPDPAADMPASPVADAPDPAREEHHRLVEENRALAAALDAVRHSTSWRVTAPVRRSVEAIRRRFGR